MAFGDRRVTLKSASQIRRMAVAGKLVAEVLDTVGAAIRPGVTTLELDRMASELIRAGGGVPSFIGVPGSIAPYQHSLCISIDSEVVHGVPGKRRIAEGQIVSVDAGAIVELRKSLGRFYQTLFAVHDPGLPIWILSRPWTEPA